MANWIEVYIEMCGDLPDCDRGKRDLTDAYVKIICAGNTNRTQTVRDNLDPYFRHTLKIPVGYFVNFEVYDKDKWTSDDLIGRVRIDDPNADGELHNHFLIENGNRVEGDTMNHDGTPRHSYIRIRFGNENQMLGRTAPVDTVVVPNVLNNTSSVMRTPYAPTITTSRGSLPTPPADFTAGLNQPSSMDRIRTRRAARRRRQNMNTVQRDPLPQINSNEMDKNVGSAQPPPPHHPHPPPPPPPSPAEPTLSPVPRSVSTAGNGKNALLSQIQNGTRLKKASERKLSPTPPPDPKRTANPRSNMMGDLMKAMDTRRHAIDDTNDPVTGSGLIFGELQDADDSDWAI
jgi:C2 domain/WH2 motif